MDKVVSERLGETTHLGSYEIIRRLARGGMAELFLARGRGTTGGERVVVLKKILPKHADNPRLMQRIAHAYLRLRSLDANRSCLVTAVGIICSG